MKQIQKITGLKLVMLGAIAIGTLFPHTGIISIANAQGTNKSAEGESHSKSCSAKSIKGNYSYTAQGSVLAGSPLPVPPGLFASIGTVKLDGFGNITEHITNDNFNGLILPPINYTGTYTVSPDCSGTAVLVGRAPYKFTIADSGSRIYFMLDAPDTVITGIANRQ